MNYTDINVDLNELTSQTIRRAIKASGIALQWHVQVSAWSLTQAFLNRTGSLRAAADQWLKETVAHGLHEDLKGARVFMKLHNI
jgi:post-segregation antitoxin (ccd killing protein)